MLVENLDPFLTNIKIDRKIEIVKRESERFEKREGDVRIYREIIILNKKRQKIKIKIVLPRALCSRWQISHVAM